MRTKISNKKRDGFAGELLISIPQNVLAGAIQKVKSCLISYMSVISVIFKAFIPLLPTSARGVSTISCSTVSRERVLYPRRPHVYFKSQSIRNRPCHRQTAGLLGDTEDPWSIWVHFTSDALQAFNRAYHIVPEQGPQYIPHNEKGIRIWEEMSRKSQPGL